MIDEGGASKNTILVVSAVCFCLFSLIQDNPEVAMDSIVHITQHMNTAQRAEVSRILANMET
jgi:hypothetical protein